LDPSAGVKQRAQGRRESRRERRGNIQAPPPAAGMSRRTLGCVGSVVCQEPRPVHYTFAVSWCSHETCKSKRWGTRVERASTLPRLQGLHRWSAPARARSHGGTDGLRQAECRRGPMYGACDFRRLRFQTSCHGALPTYLQDIRPGRHRIERCTSWPATLRPLLSVGDSLDRVGDGCDGCAAAKLLAQRPGRCAPSSFCGHPHAGCPGDTAREPPRTLGAPSEAEACGSWAVRPRTAALTCKRGAGFLRTRQTASCACVGHSAPEGRAIRDPICIMRDRLWGGGAQQRSSPRSKT